MLDIREEKDLLIIKPLWQALNRHHMVHSRHFDHLYRKNTFEARIEKFDAVDDYRLEIICQDKKPLGYILASMKDGVGEIDSFYIYDDLRGLGLGEYLMKRMILWLQSNGAESVVVDVAAGNEEVIGFYHKMGFYTSKHTMRLGE
ncbi:GNAT family N-acetyltransferase [Acidaminobacter sp. JC074]|uniref:GNAT family N-acetyltransferase n=1 Tax=Acidaminobacter sp. JC074 TaxID=2530199 RepID=UPI001F0D39C0|nr:GNAT family N-acetyltransferase [Acidaminobacter sp. JC074]MCH4890246.1 GNAT family N-acetyltransferase [Acidaminobacter sp. JC074]